MALNSAQFLDLLHNMVEINHHKNDLNLDVAWILAIFLETEMELQGLMPWSSNYTFLASFPTTDDHLLAIYKPCRGERPLWDFPDGALCQREFATYLVSEVLGWPRVPPTILRDDGPHGRGTIQLFIEAEYEAHYFNMRHIQTLTPEFRKIALFDYIVNNADRKGGHCLKDKKGQIWAIDHGLTFHADYKLRTVIWEFCNEQSPDPLLNDLTRLKSLITKPSELCQVLEQLINPAEIRAFQKRIDRVLANGHFPSLRHGRNVPYPPI